MRMKQCTRLLSTPTTNALAATLVICMLVSILEYDILAGRLRTHLPDVAFVMESGSGTKFLMDKEQASDAGIDEAIEISLREWQTVGVSRASVTAALGAGLQQDYGCFGVTYINSKLYTWGSDTDQRSEFPGPLFRSRRQHILLTLRNVTVGNRIGDFEAVFCLGDCVTSQKFFDVSRHLGDVYPLHPDPLPVFSIVKCQGSMNIPYPIWDEATGPFTRWESEVGKLKNGARKVPWEERKSQAVFRGGQRTCVLHPKVGQLNDGRTFYEASPDDPEAAKKCGRTALLYQALRSAKRNMFNVSLTSGYSISHYAFNLNATEDVPRYLTTEQFEAFRYIIYAEGHCQWANRLRKHLFMGAVIIMQVTQCVEPYGLRLKPWVHFIPVDYWFTNLTEAVVWGETHQLEAQQMIERMHRYAEEHVSARGILHFIGQLMLKYSELMQHNITMREGAREVQENCAQ